MKVTAQDIHHKEFKRAIRGYSEEEVDLFLDQVSEEVERLEKKNQLLDQEVHELKENVKTYKNMELTLQNTLLTAQKSAEEVQMNAKKEADLVVSKAKEDARVTLSKANKQRKILGVTFEKLKSLEAQLKNKIKGDLESLLTILRKIDSEELNELGKVEEECSKVLGIETEEKNEEKNEAPPAKEEVKNEIKEEKKPSKKKKSQKELSLNIEGAKADASKSDIASEEVIDDFLKQDKNQDQASDNGDMDKKGGFLGRIFKKKEASENDILENQVQVKEKPAKKKKAKKSKKKNTEEIKV